MSTSSAMSVRSVIQMAVNVCTYHNGNPLSAAHKADLANYIMTTNLDKMCNIQTAVNIFNKFRQITDQGAYGFTIANTSGKSLQTAVSKNTALAIMNRQFPVEDRKYFFTWNMYYNTDQIMPYQVFDSNRIRKGKAIADVTIVGNIIGGGGGGSGGVAARGDKNARYTISSGAGGNGFATTAEATGGRSATATGGTGGAARTITITSNNYTGGLNGQDGNSGQSVPIQWLISKGQKFEVRGGCGGGGGSGVGASHNGNNQTLFTGNSGANATVTGGGDGAHANVAANAWTGSDATFGGGGGGGGRVDGGGPGGKGGNNLSSGVANGIGTQTSASGSLYTGIGGRGGFTSRGGASDVQPTTLGFGGRAGRQATPDSPNSSIAGGGNGGNIGGFRITSGGDALFGGW